MINKNNNIIGVDPGLTGAICLLNHKRELLALVDMPVIKIGKKFEIDSIRFWNVVADFKNFDNSKTIAVVEQVGAMRVHGRQQGGVSMFSFGMGYGMIRQGLVCAGIDYTLVLPQVWKKRAGLIGREKDASRIKAKIMFPSAALNLKKHHGRADALLIAYYGGGV